MPRTVCAKLRGIVLKRGGLAGFRGGTGCTGRVDAWRAPLSSRGRVAAISGMRQDAKARRRQERSIVSDGQTLKVYQPADKQMFVQDVNASMYPVRERS